jgi:SNF2 family DNA or RNA helicase
VPSSLAVSYLYGVDGLKTELRPHQLRAIEKLRASGGLLAAHGLGSGKTLTSIAAAQALGLPIEAIVPAPLVANYEKELEKHLEEPPEDARIRSYQRVTRNPDVRPDALAVLDEAHRIRNVGTSVEREVARRAAGSKARLLLTGTPVFNVPSDLAPLLNTAAGARVLPNDPRAFNEMFVGEETLSPGFLARLRGVKPSKVPTLKNRERLIEAAKGYVDVHRGGGEGFPERIDEAHEVTMSPMQREIYHYHEDKIPFIVAYKVRHNLPLSKAESKNLNKFQSGLRQVSNTPRPYIARMTDQQEEKHSPKLRKIVDHAVDMWKTDPNHRGVIYSNYLEGGLLPMSRMLAKNGVPHGIFHGGLSKNDKAQMVRDYNGGKLPMLLVSSSGAEGLDLKGTKSIQITEPHWNDSKIDQVIGRGIRYKSHDHLPEEERKVRVMRYYSTHPKPFLFGTPEEGIERYMQNMAQMKGRLGTQVMDALQEASDYGPLKKTAAKYGLPVRVLQQL